MNEVLAAEGGAADLVGIADFVFAGGEAIEADFVGEGAAPVAVDVVLLLFEMAGACGAPCCGGDGIGNVGVEVGEEEALEFGDEAGALPGFAWVIDDEFEGGCRWI